MEPEAAEEAKDATLVSRLPKGAAPSGRGLHGPQFQVQAACPPLGALEGPALMFRSCAVLLLLCSLGAAPNLPAALRAEPAAAGPRWAVSNLPITFDSMRSGYNSCIRERIAVPAMHDALRVAERGAMHNVSQYL